MIVRASKRFQSDKGCFRYKTYDQLVAISFGQLNKCMTLEDISCGISVSGTFIKDLGLTQSPARSTMSDGNKNRDWRVFEYLYYSLLKHYKGILGKAHRSDLLREVENHAIKIIDSSTISLCLELFDWAKFRTAKGGIKIHTQWDEAMMLPDIVNITPAKVHDSKGLPNQTFEKGTIIIEDKGYFDFSVMAARIKAGNFFVTRIKDNTSYKVINGDGIEYEDQDYILIDQQIMLTGKKAIENKMDRQALRKIIVHPKDQEYILEIIANNLDWSALTIALLYKMRWAIEIFFKTLKQNLQVKTFVGTSENAVKSQIFIALTCYLLLEIIRRAISKTKTAFSNFCERVRICLCYYQGISYVCDNIKQGAHRIDMKPAQIPGLEPDLFSQ
jgi:hypothetical protein